MKITTLIDWFQVNVFHPAALTVFWARLSLLLHGLTDSPYSLRRIGEILYARGFYVLGLRLPGHGTAPVASRNTLIVRNSPWLPGNYSPNYHNTDHHQPQKP